MASSASILTKRPPLDRINFKLWTRITRIYRILTFIYHRQPKVE